MTAVLGLRLVGAMQAWGSESRFATRASDDSHTKSGVIGLLAAAKGIRRTDPIEDLTGLRFGVRIDQPGSHLRDFQTAASLDRRQVMPLSYRHYLVDARFLVGLEGCRVLLAQIAEALRNPTFPLYLGRRSCPPSEPLIPWMRDTNLEHFLRSEPWIASPQWRNRYSQRPSRLEFRLDADGVSTDLDEFIDGERLVRDQAVSFDPQHRRYAWRRVVMGALPTPGDEDSVVEPSVVVHDPFSALE